MVSYREILLGNANYRRLWFAQVISELGDWFANVAVLGLSLQLTGSPLVVTGVMLANTVPAIFTGPLAGVVVDRVDRKRVLIAADVIRAFLALGFILIQRRSQVPWIYVLTGLMMFVSLFFRAGRDSLLPAIASGPELLTANALVRSTMALMLAAGGFAGGIVAGLFGFRTAFLLNALSFIFSAAIVLRIQAPRARPTPERVPRDMASGHPLTLARHWVDYTEGLKYIRGTPLVLGIVLLGVGWATGGGPAQILFSLFGDQVFRRGVSGIGILYSAAGVGILLGTTLTSHTAHHLSYKAYKWLVAVCYLLHGLFYALFSQAGSWQAAIVLIGLSRLVIGISLVLNATQLMRVVPDGLRGRVFATSESATLTTMMLTMTLAGFAANFWGVRTIGLLSGILTGSTAFYWLAANRVGWLPLPPVPVQEEAEPAEELTRMP